VASLSPMPCPSFPEWHADEARHRVLRLLRQVSGLGSGRGPASASGCCAQTGRGWPAAPARGVTAPARMVTTFA